MTTSNKESIDRYLLAWVRFNATEWDDFLGDKPNNYEELSVEEKRVLFSNKMREIERLLGDNHKMLTSWGWWKYQLNKSFDEWISWYMYDRLR